MCGISCVLALEHSHTSQTPANRSRDNTYGIKHHADEREKLSKELDDSLEMIKHRGPDARGQWISEDGRVALGHVRLSINDLSPAASQPFHDAANNVQAVVNGEFYDYDRIRAELEDTTDFEFRSRSDSEIVIALYLRDGLNFVHHLRGEFAVVLFDKEAQLFVAFRDRYGIKPLFWTIQKGRMLVAAEMKAFLPLGWKPEWDVQSLLDAGWNHDERTIFKGISKIRPGHYMTCQSFDHIEQRPYWDIAYPDKRAVDPRTPQEMVDGVRQHLLEAIKFRLRADVPIGVYLSGGIDSSVIAGMVTHLVKEQGFAIGSASARDRVSCFSIAFDEDSGFDESSIANRTAEWLGVKYHTKLMNEEEQVKRFEDAVWHCEHHNPDMNFVGKFALSELTQERGYKVVLTGEGADEIFAGYPVYLPDYLREPDFAWEKYNTLPEAERLNQLKLAEEATRAYYESVGADASNRGPSLARRMLKDITTVSSMAAFQLDVFADWTTSHGRCDPRITIANNVDGRVRKLITDSWHPLHSAEYVWSKGHLANIFLTCLGDRTEMAHSIEARTPFLDHELTQYVNNLPPSAKVRWLPRQERFVEKWVLREAARPFVTPELYERKKHPYSAPTRYPVGGPMHHMMERLMTRDNVEQLGFVSWEKCKALVRRAFEEGDPGAMRHCIVVAEWVVLSRRFGVEKAGGLGGM